MNNFTPEELDEMLTKTGHLLYDYNIAEGKIRSLGAIEQITGMTKEQFNSTNIHSWSERMHPDDKPNAHNTQLKFLLEGGSYHGFYRIRREDGEYIQVQDKGFAYEEEEITGTPTRMTGLISIFSPDHPPA